MSRRYAIYYAPPPGSALEAFGAHWLGRHHVTGERLPRPAVEGFTPDELEAHTAFPRTYGFHATLKAPFVLAEGQSADGLHQAVRSFAAARRPFACPGLHVTGLSGFISFQLREPSPAMQDLAAACVRDFEPFRAPLPADELARRRRAGLTPEQDDYLVRFGYPYVFEGFHFHMTLTGWLEEPVRGRLLAVLQERARPVVAEPFGVDAIAIYEQPEPRAPFTLTARFPFGG